MLRSGKDAFDDSLDLFLGGRVIAALRDDALGVFPDLLTEGRRSGSQVTPGDSQPTLPGMVAHPNLADVVGVVVDFPLAVSCAHTGVLAPKAVEYVAVIEAIVDLDAVGVDDAPFHAEQLDVVISGKGNRNVATYLEQCGVLLVRK